MTHQENSAKETTEYIINSAVEGAFITTKPKTNHIIPQTVVCMCCFPLRQGMSIGSVITSMITTREGQVASRENTFKHESQYRRAL